MARELKWKSGVGPIIVVDDDLDDAKLTKRAVERLQPITSVRILDSGKKLLAYLEGEGKYGNRDAHPLPSLILLDLKMPQVDGFAILEWVRGERKYAHIPIVVVSGVEDFNQMKRAYALNARSLLNQAAQFGKFLRCSVESSRFRFESAAFTFRSEIK
jgi:CheY-like chemotaxis protein